MSWVDDTVTLSKRPGGRGTTNSKAVNEAKRTGAAVETTAKYGAGGNHSQAQMDAAKLDRETEELKHKRLDANVGKLIAQGRAAKGWSQKDLATRICEKPAVIQEMEQGKAIPNQQILGKIERNIDESKFGGLILEHPEWWLRNDDGSLFNDAPRPYVDFTVPEALDWWVSVPLAAAKLANGSMGGMFCDGAVIANFTSPKFSAARTDAWSKAHWVAIQKLHDELHALPNADMVLIGNTITDNLRNPTNNGVQLLQSGALDGACAEHFGAFEWLDPQGNVNMDVVRQWIEAFKEAGQLPDKEILVKTWIGPEVAPLTNIGPSWPKSFVDPVTGKPLAYTEADIAVAAAHMVNYSLATFLCIAEENFYLGYSWWYVITQGYLPGLEAPVDWYPEFSMPIGNALGAAVYTKNGTLCSRQFEHVHVEVDFTNYGSAKVTPTAGAARGQLPQE